MNHNLNYILKGFVYIIFLLCTISVHAQQGHREFPFKTGEQYETEMLTTSSAVLVRGKQTLNINSVTSATKLYKVTSSNNNETKIDVEFKKMNIDLDALDKKLTYKSGIGFDSTSTIMKALDFMMKKPVIITVNKFGIIQNSSEYRTELATDTLVSFAGLQPEAFEKGTLFSMLADITYNKKMLKGYTWIDSVKIDDQKLKTTFIVEDITPTTTIIKYSSSILGKLINSNSNGTYLIDNATGLIKEKILYSISRGYMISAGNIVYAVSRTTSVSETTRKLN